MNMSMCRYLVLSTVARSGTLKEARVHAAVIEANSWSAEKHRREHLLAALEQLVKAGVIVRRRGSVLLPLRTEWCSAVVGMRLLPSTAYHSPSLDRAWCLHWGWSDSNKEVYVFNRVVDAETSNCMHDVPTLEDIQVSDWVVRLR